MVPINAAPNLTGQAISALTAGTKPCVLTNGTVSCWGFNASGSTFYTGTGSSATSVYTPQPLSSTGGMANKAVTKLDSGSGSSCAIENGDLYCWGTTNGYGAISGSTGSTRWPVPAWVNDPVLKGKKFTDVAVGSANACAISEGKAYCWGDVRLGTNGAGTTTQTYGSQNWVSPAAVVDTGVLKNKTVTALSLGVNHACAIADGAVFCWGNNTYGQLGTGSLNPTDVPLAVDTSGVLAGKTVTAVTAGVYSTCVIADGEAYCWGQNSSGTLGNGTTAVSSVPTAVSTDGVLAGKTVSAISTNGNTTCVIADSAAYCWGAGSLGNGTTASSTTPVAVDASGALKGKKLLGISVGNSATYALIA
jgi:alpha-tubulin suppressor-like RCC1 family protein